MRETGAACVYCSLPVGRVRQGAVVVTLRTCVGHTDLPALDPSYGLVETLLAEPQARRGGLDSTQLRAARRASK